MAGTVWSKFFWADWLSDAGLRACSATARGVWMDMLCVAASHDPPGYVAVKDRGLTHGEIARLTGEEISSVEQSLKELEKQNVFARTRKGVIYSRRMIRDTKKTKLARKNGKLGGNPSLRKHKRNSVQDNGVVTPNGDSSTCHKPESISQGGFAPKQKTRARATPLFFDDWPENYRERFEAVYANQVGMKAALASLDHVATTRHVSFEFMISRIKNYFATKPADQKPLNPKTFIEQERWNDRPAAQAKPNGSHQSLAEYAAQRARELEAIERAGASGSTPDAIGGDEVGGDHARIVSGKPQP